MIKAKSAEVYVIVVEEARMILRTIRTWHRAMKMISQFFSNDSLIATFNDFTLYVKTRRWIL